ncbi:MAG: D-alanyl-D-alanine carboxypeptidase family protein [Erysipelotrichaceae bacterium]|nr:D-alanyl-D-alanine carboxypeptidase family protein [Erysipelotrichaceae bacterium]
MKKVLILVLLALLFCGCEKSLDKKLQELGYSEEEILKISELNEEHQALFLEGFDETALKYIKDMAFDEEKFEEYLKYDGKLEQSLLMRLINDGILNDKNAEKLFKMYSSENFIAKNENLYLQYLDSYDSLEEMMEIVNTKRYEALFSDIEPVDMSKGDLILVNKYYQLSEDYVPDDLVDIDPSLGRGQIRGKVYEAYLKLLEDARALGYNLYVVSAFRSFAYQDGLYNKYLRSDPQEVVDTYSARPGHSEHQTGMAMDVTVPGYSLDDFGTTDAAKWLNENCCHYGFIIRYPADKTDITGYIEEPWHIRYLGVETAEDVYARKMTYDEYYACFVE